jgi:hypothetical protein
MRRRVQKTAEAAAPPPVEDSNALASRFTKMIGGVPGVLTVEAVEAGYMPELGTSGLPASLEPDVPAEYRYWKAATADEARAARDALVEQELFTPSSLTLVDGELRRFITKKFLVVEEDAAATLEAPEPAGLFAAAQLTKSDAPVEVYDADVSPKLEEVAKYAKEPTPWLGVYQDDAVTRAALQAAALASVFKLRTRPGLLFASNLALSEEASAAALLMQPMEKRKVRLLKKKATTEERIVYGIVLEPETEDSQTDIYSADEVRKAAHGFMEGYRNGNYTAHQHDGLDITDQLLVLESFIAPVDFDLDGEPVKKGTWLMSSRILSDTIWEGVKKGEVTGYSIGGDAFRNPEPRPAAG